MKIEIFFWSKPARQREKHLLMDCECILNEQDNDGLWMERNLNARKKFLRLRNKDMCEQVFRMKLSISLCVHVSVIVEREKNN